MKIARAGGWLSARVGDELVMMNVDQKIYLGLTEVGARVWELLESEGDLDRICEALQQEFDVAPSVCRSEVAAFVEQMSGRGIVTLEPA